jgi:predicted lipoprotein with Yx(FWY)xxD motif
MPEMEGETLSLAESDRGELLVDGEGATLYLFVPDAQGASTCYDACADNWPALVGEVSAGDGVDGGLLGSVARDDGSQQVTYNGWPLYYFAGDSAPGDTNGQGLNEVWFVVSATGEANDG